MLIKSIILENFKGIQKRTRIEFKPITLLFGANSSGKSIIMQALLYAREILEHHNLDPIQKQIGGFRNLVNQHDLNKDIVIGFELDISANGLPKYLSGVEDYILSH